MFFRLIFLSLFSFSRSSTPSLRDFSLSQLSRFNGVDETKRYLALDGLVYDLSPLLSLSPSVSPSLSPSSSSSSSQWKEMSGKALSLSSIENENMDLIRSLPLIGYLSQPATDLSLSLTELAKYNGNNEKLPGRVHPQIFISIQGNIFDVSYGGYHLYGPGGSYSIFAGKDASRALAKMSFESNDIHSTNLSDLTEEQKESLAGWFSSYQKKYPVVGKLKVN